MSYPISTARLQLRKLTLQDSVFIQKLVNDPDCIRFIGDRGVHNEQDAEKYLLDGPLRMYQEFGFGLLLVLNTTNLEPMGMCGLLQRDYMELPDIGFAFMPEFRAKGYALEAAKAVLIHAREELNITKVAGMVSPDNQLSISLLEKLGLHYHSNLVRDELGGPTKLFTN